MNHLVLLGDSVFDNAAYVQGGAALIDQVRSELPQGWKASPLAVDGSTCVDVSAQLQRVPVDATHLLLSAGGNDALGCLGRLELPVSSVKQALQVLMQIQTEFQRAYCNLLHELLAQGLPLMVCTIYDSVPGMPAPLKTALSLFNDVIVREALRHQVPVLDLRHILTDAADYSRVSPIEPSSRGGAKLATAVARRTVMLTTNSSQSGRQA